MMDKRAQIKNLSVLINKVHEAAVSAVEIALIDTEPQIRTEFRQDSLKEFAEEIKTRGVIQPVVVRPGKEGRFRMVAGERRLRAAKLAGLKVIPAVVKPLTDDEARAYQRAENIHRENLTLTETARAVARDYDSLGNIEKVAKEWKKSGAWVSRYLALTTLPATAQRLIDEQVTSDPEVILGVARLAKVDATRAAQFVEVLRDPGVHGRELLREELAVAGATDKRARARTASPSKTGGDAPRGRGGPVLDAKAIVAQANALISDAKRLGAAPYRQALGSVQRTLAGALQEAFGEREAVRLLAGEIARLKRGHPQVLAKKGPSKKTGVAKRRVRH